MKWSKEGDEFLVLLYRRIEKKTKNDNGSLLGRNVTTLSVSYVPFLLLLQAEC